MTKKSIMPLKGKKSEEKIKKYIEKVVVNAGIGKHLTSSSIGPKTSAKKAKEGESAVDKIVKDFAIIVGQRPQSTQARKSIAGFKIRQGQVVGLKCTLRGKRMVDFLTRLNTIVLPRTPDFRGIDLKKIDEGGSLHIGLKEQFMFPEINPEESIISFSLGINIVPKHKNKEAAIENYKELGVPLK